MVIVRQLQALKAVVPLLVLLLAATSLLAEPGNHLLDVWTSDEGLPDSSVSAIAQTPDNYLWIGTYNGLARFDGVRFVTFDPVTTPELKNARIMGLFVDAWGTLWINTYDGSVTSLRNGVFNYEWRGGQVLSVFSTTNQVLFTLAGHHSRMTCRNESSGQHGEWNELALEGNPTGNSFKQDGRGAIWYLASNVLYRIDGTNCERMAQDTGWRGSTVKALSSDSEGRLWIGTDEGIARWNNGRFEDWTPTNGPATVDVFSLYCTTNGCWVFGEGKVRKCVDRRWVAEVDAKSWQDLVGTFQMELNAYEDRDGGLWFAHLGSGLFHIRVDGRTEHLSTENGLPSNLASCCFQDREGNIWAGLTRGGLVRLRKKEFQVIGVAEGLGAQAVSSVCEDSRSNIWIGTFSGGLYRWRDGKLDQFELPGGPYKDCFFSVYPDSGDRLWLSAGREDLFTFENGQINPSPSAVHGIKTILVDRQRRVWFGRLAGLTRLINGVHRSPSTNGVNDIRALAEDPSGRIWVGTENGNLFCFDKGTFTRYQTADSQENRAIWSLLPESDGTLWIGTFRGGLLRLKEGKFTRYTTQEGLPNDVICQILDDRRGNLWIGSHKGIFSVSKNSFHDWDLGKIKSLPCVAYGLSDGLPALECSGNYQPACWRDHEGRLWFATVKGAVSVSPRDLSINQLAPPVVIEEIIVDGKPLPGDEWRMTGDEWRMTSDGYKTAARAVTHHPSLVTLSPGGHQVEFRYTALSFVAPDKVAFRYKLEGLDQDWVDGGTKRSVLYGALRPGKYRFQVVACNNDGVWNETGAGMNLVVQPHFWQTWWFDALMIAPLGGAVFGAARFVATRKLRRKLEQLQQQQALEQERERIARDIHDDLGAGLTQIMLQSALAQRDPEQPAAHFAQISATAFELVGAMDEIVWAVDPENDTLDAVITYAGKFVQELVAKAGLRCRLDLPAQVPPMTLSSQERHNLFLAVKEALNNAIKYSGATEIWFALKLQPSSFSLVIKDNGCGFVLGTVKDNGAETNGRLSSGHGLRNLVERMEKIGGTCVIRSEPGKGTQVELTVMIQKKSRTSQDLRETGFHK